MRRCVNSEYGKVAVAGSGFLADGYDLFIISCVLEVIRDLPQMQSVDSATFKLYESMMASCALYGAIFGQLIFGALADMLGRRVIFLVTGSLIIGGSVLSAGCSSTLWKEQGPEQLLLQIAICRAILGFGIGGEYPLSASICSEGVSARTRSTKMALVFSNQGLGYLLASSLMLVLVFSEAPGDFIWRFALGFGAVVPALSLYFRALMHESHDFQKSKRIAHKWDTVCRYRWHILGTALNWFIFDILFYGNNMFHSDIAAALGVGSGLRGNVLKTFILVCMQLPGYYFAVFFINRLGRKNMQLMGLFAIGLLYLTCSLTYRSLGDSKDGGMQVLFLILYGLTFFFSNFGPNTSTYVIPGEIFPSQIKATAHGWSAAAGKAGAALGATVFPQMIPSGATADSHLRIKGIQTVLMMCAVLSAVAVLITVCLTPRYSSEELEARLPGEIVGFVPLRWQRAARDAEVKAWKEAGCPSDPDKTESTEEASEEPRLAVSSEGVEGAVLSL